MSFGDMDCQCCGNESSYCDMIECTICGNDICKNCIRDREESPICKDCLTNEEKDKK